jgi:hypothetical protein
MDDIVSKALAMTSGQQTAPRSAVPRFSIKPQPFGAPTGKAGMFKSAEGSPTMKDLKASFDNAISNHLSLSPADQVQNVIAADRRISPHTGTTKNGRGVPLLGKNAKLMKSETGYGDEEPVKLDDGRGIETAGLALAPAYQEGKFSTCPNSASCKDECLGKTSGNYFKVGGGQDLTAFKGPRLNSLKKTIAMMREPEAFAVKLYDEIAAAKREAARNGNHLGVRLNVLSDINPLVHKSPIEAHPDVSFYDYTKNNSNPVAQNHHYTYSSTGVSNPEIGVNNKHTNWKQMRRRLDQGDNVAMAFSDRTHLPEVVHDEETGKRYKVVNGDKHDFRPLDMQPEGADGVIVGLKNKKATGTTEGASRESGGFFVHYDPKLRMRPDGKYEREPSQGIGPSGKPLLGPTIPTNHEVRIAPQGKQLTMKDHEGKSQ